MASAGGNDWAVDHDRPAARPPRAERDPPPASAPADAGADTRMTLRALPGLFQETYNAWSADEAMRLGASLAYYTVFSLAPFLIVVIAVAGLMLGREAAQGRIIDQVQGLIGREGAEAVSALIVQASRPASSTLATVLGTLAILLGATAVFSELQSGLNKIWKVPAPPGWGVVFRLRARFRSFALVLGIGFLLMVSLVLGAVITAVGEWVTGFVPALKVALAGVHFGLSFVMTAILFAMIFKLLPDTWIAWSDVWIGAAATSLFFTLGQAAIAIYLGQSTIGSVYGAAGSLVVILVWVYYSSQVLFFGAEFTQIYACRFGSRQYVCCPPSSVR